MLYLIRLADYTIAGTLETVPPILQGLNLEALADLNWIDPSAGWHGRGVWPAVETPLVYDTTTQRVGARYVRVDRETKTVRSGYEILGLTSEEIAQVAVAEAQAQAVADAEAWVAIKTAKAGEVNTLRDTILSGGWTHDFGDPIGLHTLQTRDADDKTNWLVSLTGYQAAVAQGAGAVMGANFRDTNNVTFTLSYAQGYQALVGMSAWGQSVMGNSWKLKDAITNATNQAELDAIDINAGWPAPPVAKPADPPADTVGGGADTTPADTVAGGDSTPTDTTPKARRRKRV